MNKIEAKSEHPVLAIYEQYHILKDENAISPYIVSIYALDLLEESKNYEQISNFILWYTQHANKLDHFGVSGTIYDYILDKDGVEHPLKTYDSADGYAGMYLYLIAKYYQKTKDKTLLTTIWPTIEDNIYLLLHLQDKDGLTKALATKGYQTKYLMDNVESYIGVESYLYLANILQKNTQTYMNLQTTLKKGILTELYNNDKKRFYWAKINTEKTLIKKNKFYPDIFAQIHLLAFWGKHIESEVAQKLWQEILYFYNNEKPSFAMEQLIIFQWAKTFALSNKL